MNVRLEFNQQLFAWSASKVILNHLVSLSVIVLIQQVLPAKTRNSTARPICWFWYIDERCCPSNAANKQVICPATSALPAVHLLVCSELHGLHVVFVVFRFQPNKYVGLFVGINAEFAVSRNKLQNYRYMRRSEFELKALARHPRKSEVPFLQGPNRSPWFSAKRKTKQLAYFLEPSTGRSARTFVSASYPLAKIATGTYKASCM